MQKQRPLRSYYVLVMLLYGHHDSVTWTGLRCRIRSRVFSASLGMTTTKLRQSLLKLQELGFINDVRNTWGALYAEVKPPPGRIVA